MLPLDVGPRVCARTPEDFDHRPYLQLQLRPLSPTIGAVVTGVDLAAPLPDDHVAELRRALLEWKVLFVEGQDMTRDQQRELARLWGPIEGHPFYRYVQPGQSAEDVVTLAKDDTTPGFENEWHADLTWHRTPSLGAVLRAVEVPEVGGDTLWADAGAAYDLLPDELKERIEGMEALHDWRHTFGLGMPPEAVAALDPQFPAQVHPVVRVHPETGRRTLFVNRIFTTRIVGLDEHDSDTLLARLYAQYERPEAQCRYRWSPGSVAIWDNRATLHYASSDYHPHRRVMDRISIAGDPPVGIGLRPT